MASENDFLNNDSERALDEIERHRRAIYERVSDYLDENELSEAVAAAILLDMAVRMRMTAYGISVANPSIAGVKMEMDRFRRDVDTLIALAKRNAEDFIRTIKTARAENPETQACG